MGAKENNTNAQKKGNIGTRVPACLSIADERKAKVIRKLQEQGIEEPTNQEISRFVKYWCYERIDHDM